MLQTYNSNGAVQWKLSNGKDLADADNDVANEEQLHLSSTNSCSLLLGPEQEKAGGDNGDASKNNRTQVSKMSSPAQGDTRELTASPIPILVVFWGQKLLTISKVSIFFRLHSNMTIYGVGR